MTSIWRVGSSIPISTGNKVQPVEETLKSWDQTEQDNSGKKFVDKNVLDTTEKFLATLLKK